MRNRGGEGREGAEGRRRRIWLAAREVRRGADDWRGWRSAGGGHEEAAVPLAARRTQERERGGEVEAGEMERGKEKKREGRG